MGRASRTLHSFPAASLCMWLGGPFCLSRLVVRVWVGFVPAKPQLFFSELFLPLVRHFFHVVVIFVFFCFLFLLVYFDALLAAFEQRRRECVHRTSPLVSILLGCSLLFSFSTDASTSFFFRFILLFWPFLCSLQPTFCVSCNILSL